MTAELETRVLRKVTLRIIPFVMLLYFIAFIDRVNIGFAALTMNKDLGFSPTVFGFGAGIFFLGYFLFEVPSNLVLDKVGARIWIARVMITWGLISGAMAFVQGANSFYILRFLLGAAEAGFFPGIILYLSYWFPARQRAAVTAVFMAAAPLSTVLGSPVSGALLEMHGWLGLSGWQWMFLIEAAPAVILGVVVLFYMTDRPEKATWLRDDERNWLVNAMAAEAAGKAASASHSVWRGLADPRVIALSLVYFGTSAGLYTLGIWAPQIIKEFGLTSLQVGLLNALPGIVAVIAMVIWARHSDRSGERTWHVVAACLLAAVGLVFAGFAGSVLAVMLALTLVEEAWYNSGDGNYYSASSTSPLRPTEVIGSTPLTAQGAAILGVIDARDQVLKQLVPTFNVPAVTTGPLVHAASTAHSVAANAGNNHVFVPLGANNAFPNCLTGCIAVFGTHDRDERAKR